jgi:hypothetical protein
MLLGMLLHKAHLETTHSEQRNKTSAYTATLHDGGVPVRRLWSPCHRPPCLRRPAQKMATTSARRIVALCSPAAAEGRVRKRSAHRSAHCGAGRWYLERGQRAHRIWVIPRHGYPASAGSRELHLARGAGARGQGRRAFFGVGTGARERRVRCSGRGPLGRWGLGALGEFLFR